MPKNDAPSTYRSYLLRVWRHGPYEEWRASLQDVRTEQIRYFARPDELWAFMEAEMANKSNQVTLPRFSGQRVKGLCRKKCG